MEHDEKEILKHISESVDRIAALLEPFVKPPSMAERLASGAATGVGILGILSAIDIIRTWLGG